MAANLSGMFQQMNQAIGQNPLNNQYNFSVPGMAPRPQDNVNPMLQAAVKGAGGVMGLPTDLRTSQEASRDVQKAMGDLNLGTAEGLAQASKLYGSIGMTDKQLAYSQAAEAKATTEAALQKQQVFRESLSKRALAEGLVGLSEGIASGDADLEKAAKEVRDMEKMNALILRGKPGRYVLGLQAGLTREVIDSLDDLTDPQFKDVISGQSSELKAYKGADGTARMYSVLQNGRIWDDEQAKYVEPSSLKLFPAPNEQRIVNVSAKMIEKMDMASIDDFLRLHEAANEAQGQIDNIGRSMEYINDMPTGIGAETVNFFARIADAFGMEQPSVTAYDLFMAEAGKRVMANIKNFGSGTGLSDADREYAKIISGASATVKAEALRALLQIQDREAKSTIGHFHRVKEQTRKMLGPDEGYRVDNFLVRPPLPPAEATKEDFIPTWIPAEGRWSTIDD